VEHGNNVSISCNLTERGSQQETKLVNVSLSKHGLIICRVNVCEDPLNSTILLGPVALNNVGVDDGGTYKCHLHVLLRHKSPHKVTDSTLVRSKSILLMLYKYLPYSFCSSRKMAITAVCFIVFNQPTMAEDQEFI